jgi:hypothetical protein
LSAGIALALLLAVPVRTKPNPTLTSGAIIRQATKDVICARGYTTHVRSVPSRVRRERFAAYGVPVEKSPHYELDHLISLELGGSNDPSNLWPQFYCPLRAAGCMGARQKDVVENRLHRDVCAGRLALEDAQRIIATDWLACYGAIIQGRSCSEVLVPAKRSSGP